MVSFSIFHTPFSSINAILDCFPFDIRLLSLAPENAEEAREEEVLL
jgi:hypothetical protein